MDSLSKDLYATVTKAIDEFAQLCAIKLDCDKAEIIDLWNSRASAEVKVIATKAPAKASAPRKKVVVADDVDTCEYEFKRGSSAGTRCTSKPVEGTTICRKHSKPAGKKPTGKAKEAKEADIPVVKTASSKSAQMKLQKNEYNNYMHSETNLVFDRESKQVIGKQCGSKVLDLTSEDIEECKARKFKYVIPTTITGKKGSVTVEDDNGDGSGDEEDIEQEEDED
jgi:hypothetical protein